MFELILLVPLFFGVLVVAGLVAFFAYRRAWRIPQPNEALIIVGKAKGAKSGPVTPEEIQGDVVQAINEGRTEGLDFRIATTATWVNPITSRVFRLPLDSRSTDFAVDCHDSQKIACSVKGVILYKVGDNYPAMAAAARRFLEMDEGHLNQSIRDLVTGQVRALVGGTTIPELITDRQMLMGAVREQTHEDMAKLGLQIDSLTIQDISDPNGYIQNLGRPQTEAVAQAASIAADQARQEKERAKYVADLEVAKVKRDTEVEASAYQAEEDRARETAAQSGPLARAEAEQAVVAKKTEVAQLEAQMTEKRLDAEVRKAADAEAYRVETLAEAEKARAIAAADAEAARAERIGAAEAAATRVRGQADAEAVRARGEAEAAGIEAKSRALAENGEMVIDERIAEQMPEIARAMAEPLKGVGNLTVLDGAEGLSKSVVGGIAQIGPAVEQMRGLGSRRWQEPGGPDGEEAAGAATNGAGGAIPPAAASSATSSQVLGPEAGDDNGGSATRARGTSEDGGTTTGSESTPGDGEATDDIGAKLAEAGPLFDRLRAGDYAGALAQVETDDRLHAAASDIARDPEMLKAAMDRANIRSKAARRAADRIFSHLAG